MKSEAFILHCSWMLKHILICLFWVYFSSFGNRIKDRFCVLFCIYYQGQNQNCIARVSNIFDFLMICCFGFLNLFMILPITERMKHAKIICVFLLPPDSKWNHYHGGKWIAHVAWDVVKPSAERFTRTFPFSSRNYWVIAASETPCFSPAQYFTAWPNQWREVTPEHVQ